MLNVTFAQLTAFERTVRLGGVHAAARYLGLTQPAVSQRIKELERNLDIKLFERAGRALRITPDGAALLVYADQLLRTADEMSVRMKTGDPLKGVLRLGVSLSFAKTCLEPLLKRLKMIYPDLRVAVQVGDSNILSDLLNNQLLDLAVTSDYKFADHVQRKRLGFNQHGWFVSPYYPIDAIDSREELAAHHLVITPAPSRHNETVMQWFKQVDVVPQRLSTCNDFYASISLVLGGFAIGSLPRGVMREYAISGTVRELPVLPDLPSFEVWVCYQVGELGPNLTRVVDLIEAVTAEKQIYV